MCKKTWHLKGRVMPEGGQTGHGRGKEGQCNHVTGGF